MKRVRIGVLGCASIAERSVIPAIKFLHEKYELVAVASRNLEKAQLFADKFNCEAIAGYDNLIARQDVEALYVPLPTGLHNEYIQKALKNKKHVYAEKSIALNSLDATLLVETAKKEQMALMEGYMFQYHKQHQQVHHLIESGEIGEIRNFYASFGFPPLDKENFRYNDTIGGGALMDCAGYTVRASFFILRQDLKVKAASLFYNDKTNVFGNAYMQGSNNLGVFLAFGFDNYYQCNYRIWGSKGIIYAKKAFTPKPNEIPEIILEKNNEIITLHTNPDNHFIGSMNEFYNIIIDCNKREKHYKEIIQQSVALDTIKELSVKD